VVAGIAEPPAAGLPGHADLSTRPDFEALLTTLCARATGDVHLDLGSMDFIDVSGVIALVTAARQLPAGCRLVLGNAPDSMRRILDVLGPDAVGTAVRLT
jgi:anti-anti-sigma factor